MVCKTFFCNKFSFIPEKWYRKEEEERQLQSILFFTQTQSYQLEKAKNILQSLLFHRVNGVNLKMQAMSSKACLKNKNKYLICLINFVFIHRKNKYSWFCCCCYYYFITITIILVLLNVVLIQSSAKSFARDLRQMKGGMLHYLGGTHFLVIILSETAVCLLTLTVLSVICEQYL